MDATSPDARDRLARRSLARHRALATSLLVLMAGLTAGTYALPQHAWWVEVLQAASKAGFVGGIADWFAVTALFRHPLGLPIPHTAIIPAQKARLGRALGRFVAEHVFTEDEVARLLIRLDAPRILERFLSDRAATEPAARALAGMLPRLLASVEDGRAGRAAGRLLPRLIGGPGAGRVVAQVLRKLVEGGRHQDVFGFLIVHMKVLLSEKEDALQAAIAERVREQGGRLVGWAVGAQVARRVLAQINAELERMTDDASELREAFDEWIRREIARIEDDPDRATEIGRALRRVFTHPALQAWIWDVWARARVALARDAARPNSRVVLFVEQALGNLGTLLASDPGVRRRVDEAIGAITARLLPAAQLHLADFIAEVVTHWDTRTVVERLELRVGPDLQYVRINGTLVGFIVGGLVYAVLRATFGHASF